MAELLTKIPFKIKANEMMTKLRINSEMDKNRFLEIINKLEEIAVPKAVYRKVQISRKTDSYIMVDKHELKSKILSKNIGDTEELFVYVVTVGEELDRWAKKFTDILEAYWLEEILKDVLNSAVDYVYNIIEEEINSDITSDMNPGSLPDWPIDEQAKIFSLLNPEKNIGVSLTESYLMLPAKSISGIKFSSKKKFINCQLCDRENCPNRRTAYAP